MVWLIYNGITQKTAFFARKLDRCHVRARKNINTVFWRAGNCYSRQVLMYATPCLLSKLLRVPLVGNAATHARRVLCYFLSLHFFHFLSLPPLAFSLSFICMGILLLCWLLLLRVKGGSRGAAGTAYDTENGLLVGWNELNLRCGGG